MDPRVEAVEETMRVIGGRWKPAIMFSLIVGGTKRFSELRRDIPGVSQRMLTAQLRDLTRHGLVQRTLHPEVPPRVEYQATELGRSLHSIYRKVCDWSRRNATAIASAKRHYDREERGKRRVPFASGDRER